MKLNMRNWGTQTAAFLLAGMVLLIFLDRPPADDACTAGRKAPILAGVVSVAVWLTISARKRMQPTQGPGKGWLRPAALMGAISVAAIALYVDSYQRLTYRYPHDAPRTVHLAGLQLTDSAAEYLQTHGVSISELVAAYGGPLANELVWERNSLRRAGLILAAEYCAVMISFLITIALAIDDVVGSQRPSIPGIHALVPRPPGKSNTRAVPRAFVSYSHKDIRHLLEFKRMLAPAIRSGAICLWDDSRILTGANWRREIEVALRSAEIAVLLVTDHFLASEFIANQEFKPLLERAQTNGTSVFWVHVSPAMYEHTDIVMYQAAHDVSKPLSTLARSQRLVAWRDICTRLVQVALRSSAVPEDDGA
jgi:hypothetical protein